MIPRRQIVKEAGRSKKTRFYASLSDVPHNVEYEDGERIYVAFGGLPDCYKEYIFQRTSLNNPAGGVLHDTGVITSGISPDW